MRLDQVAGWVNLAKLSFFSQSVRREKTGWWQTHLLGGVLPQNRDGYLLYFLSGPAFDILREFPLERRDGVSGHCPTQEPFQFRGNE